MGNERVLLLRVSVGVEEMSGYSTFPRVSDAGQCYTPETLFLVVGADPSEGDYFKSYRQSRYTF